LGWVRNLVSGEYMREKTILTITGVVCITVLEALNLVYLGFDGVVFSGVVGAIVFLITRKRYKL